MPDFHRHRVAGGCYFFTVNLLARHGNTLLTDRIEFLRESVRHARRSRPFTIDAWVILPDHLHAVWTLPPGDDDFSTRWRLIKTFFVRGRRSAAKTANAASGSAASGNTASMTMRITARTSTTSTSIRSSTASSRRRRSGRIPRLV
jgi:REP element-mobilizing transposase RayT